MPHKSGIEKLRAENVMLRDLLETAYRKVDEARTESEKADDECLELKAELLKLRAIGSQEGIDLVYAWKRKYEIAIAGQCK